MSFLTENELFKLAPSVFATDSAENTSEKYAHISTTACIKGLGDLGFFPVSAQESSCRNRDNRPYVKHLVRFRKQDVVAIDGLL